MTEISASLVKELRERTGMGMMDCKQALLETDGDIAQAIEELRKSSGIKASKKAGRSAADGILQIQLVNSIGFMVEINCETDFVAKDGSFVENIVVRRVFITDDAADHTGIYLHSNKKIACIVCLKGGNEEVAKDIAMHIAATDPLAITSKDIPEETVKKEQEIFEAQSADSGKSAEIIVKMVEGKVKKFLSEVSLIEQDFVKDPGLKIKSLLDKNKAEVIQFKRFEVGEGIEIEETDFAAEVMSQIEKT